MKELNVDQPVNQRPAAIFALQQLQNKEFISIFQCFEDFIQHEPVEWIDKEVALLDIQHTLTKYTSA